MQSSSQVITANEPTPSFFTGRMPFLSPNQQRQSTEGKSITDFLVFVPTLSGGILALSVVSEMTYTVSSGTLNSTIVPHLVFGRGRFLVTSRDGCQLPRHSSALGRQHPQSSLKTQKCCQMHGKRKIRVTPPLRYPVESARHSLQYLDLKQIYDVQRT